MYTELHSLPYGYFGAHKKIGNSGVFWGGGIKKIRRSVVFCSSFLEWRCCRIHPLNHIFKSVKSSILLELVTLWHILKTIRLHWTKNSLKFSVYVCDTETSLLQAILRPHDHSSSIVLSTEPAEYSSDRTVNTLSKVFSFFHERADDRLRAFCPRCIFHIYALCTTECSRWPMHYGMECLCNSTKKKGGWRCRWVGALVWDALFAITIQKILSSEPKCNVIHVIPENSCSVVYIVYRNVNTMARAKYSWYCIIAMLSTTTK